jgi:hypothetical protein
MMFQPREQFTDCAPTALRAASSLPLHAGLSLQTPRRSRKDMNLACKHLPPASVGTFRQVVEARLAHREEKL